MEKRNFFDEINRNKRNSVILTGLFFAFVIFIGYILGYFYRSPIGGIILATIIAIIYSLIVFSAGESIILASNNAKPATKHDNAYIINTVEGLAIAAGIPAPKVYIIEDEAINAFATGKNPQKSYIAVTTGAINKLTREELEGVLAHEMSHIKNYDIRLMLTVIVLIGTVAILSDILMRSFLFSGRRDDRDNGSAGLLFLAIGVILAILTPIIAELTRLAISRKREYLADSSGAMLTRNPDGLAKALKKIKSDHTDMQQANKATANLYISNPFRKGGFMSSLWSTHPPLDERIKRLEEM